MTNAQPRVTVTQADRDAAAHASFHYHSPAKRNAMARGEMDEHPLIQAFARHRTAAQPECEAALTTPAPAVTRDEIVAVLECADYALRSARGFILQKHGTKNPQREEALDKLTAILSRLRGEAPMPEEAVERAHDQRASEAEE